MFTPEEVDRLFLKFILQFQEKIQLSNDEANKAYALWKNLKYDEIKVCPFILKQGLRKGSKCGKRLRQDSDFCENHTPGFGKMLHERYKYQNSCKFILQQGIHKGEMCRIKCEGELCPKHAHPKVLKNRCKHKRKYGLSAGENCPRRAAIGSLFCKVHVNSTTYKEED